MNSSSNLQNKQEQIKYKIMKKYGISYDEASTILLKLEEYNTNSHEKNINSKKNYNYNSNSHRIQNSKTDHKSNNTTADENINPTNSKSHIESLNKKSTLKLTQQDKVDSILENIVPNYNSNLSVELEHVNLSFEVQNEKIDTLKESFIRTLKRDKSKKFIIHALKDVTFKIYKGEKIGIIGYNGAGKSTLLNVITGIYHPDEGNVITYGNISPLLSLGAGFDMNFSGRKNILLNGAILGYDKEYLLSRMEDIIEFSELGDFIDIPIKNYSSGMLAKLGFSIATFVNPDILIIDEILGVGDVTFAKKSADKIRSLMDSGTTVILVSHSIPQIRELCDKAIWMDNGCVREIGEVNKVCDHYLKDAEKATNEQLANIQFK